MKTIVLLSIFSLISVCNASVGQISNGQTSKIGGIWKGESICTVHPSSCHDEQVVYHATEPGADGKFQIAANKIVNGQEEDMGTLDCSFDKEHSSVTCPMNNGTWEFKVDGASMTGTLKLPDNTIFRKVSVTRSE